MAVMTTRASHALEGIEALCEKDLSAQELIEQASERLAQVVPIDGLFMATADPETALSMGAGTVTGMPEETCQPLWDHEFLVPDYNKFADLAAGPRHVGDLHTATGGKPERSARWREFHALVGFRSEVRVAFTAGGLPWGMAQLNRSDDLPLFSEDDVDFLERAAPVIGRGLRTAVLYEACSFTDRGPGILVLDADGELVSATVEAEAWLGEVESTLFGERRGVPVPIEAHMFAAATRAGGEARPLRARLRTRDGMWLVLHASPLRGGQTDGEIAIVIEPAKARDIAPIIVEAYGLTPREVDVTRRVARGLKTADIGKDLFLSAHTVRDHLKSIFEKVGVSSRGELVSKLFAEHHHDDLAEALHASMQRSGAA
jgi:DNA-binding CsgD family transcriptional regulator